MADARRIALISRSHRKTDRRDAETLARLLAGMPELLGAVHHRPLRGNCDLQRYGERIAARGGKAAKGRAVVAVARRLASAPAHLAG